MNNLKKQIELARQSILKRKEFEPHIFAEYQNMEYWRLQLEHAQLEFNNAKRKWEKLGN